MTKFSLRAIAVAIAMSACICPAATAQSPSPAADDVVKRIAECLGAENFEYKVNIVREIEKTYKEQGTAGFKSEKSFLDKFPESQRLAAYNAYVKCIKKVVSLIPSDLFNVVELGDRGATSIAYLESKLGTAKSKNSRSAEFIADGYLVKANFLDKANANGEKGTLIRISVKVRDVEAARNTPIVLDGYWNPLGCRIDHRGAETCRKDILQLGLGDGHRLSEFIEVESCDPQVDFGTRYTGSSYFCVLRAYGSNLFIERIFEVQPDEKLIAPFLLLNHLREPEMHPMAKDVIQSLESEVGLRSTTERERFDELYTYITKIYASATVIGFSISVENIENYYGPN